jgi:uncharacterized Zn-binding protein involved in type VI secretion
MPEPVWSIVRMLTKPAIYCRGVRRTGGGSLAFAQNAGEFAQMTLHRAIVILSLVSALSAATAAQSQTEPPGVVVRGSSDVQSGDLPAARAGDATTSPSGTVTEGSSNVFINGRPAARVGDRTNCGVIVRGSNNVFINGKPMARVGDNTSGC